MTGMDGTGTRKLPASAAGARLRRGGRRGSGVAPALRALCAAVVLATAVEAAPAMAQSDQRVPVEQATTQQKAVFVENLVTRSVAAKTIENDGDAGAKAKLAEARSLVQDAKTDLEQGRYEEANGKLDHALRLVNAEARRLSESDVKARRQEKAYEKRLNAVRIFLSAYERVAGEKELSAAAAAQVSEIRAQLARAEQLAAAGQVAEATDLLDSAYQAARGDIRGMREGETLTRSLNFATAEEEYRYEKDRNDSHVMLLKFAIAEKNPPATRLKRIEQLRQEADGLREQAERQAESSDHETAIGTVIQSTDTLLKAIRMSGVWIPG